MNKQNNRTKGLFYARFGNISSVYQGGSFINGPEKPRYQIIQRAGEDNLLVTNIDRVGRNVFEINSTIQPKHKLDVV